MEQQTGEAFLLLFVMNWIDAKIEEIVRDRRHGASQLASQAIRLLIGVCRRWQTDDPEDLILTIERTAFSLASSRPSMAPIRNWCGVFVERFQQQTFTGISVREARRQGVRLGEELLTQQQRLVQRQVQAARPLLRGCGSVLTLSYSFTVESILRNALAARCRVSIAESRPLMEGRRLFTKLQGRVTHLRMITDAQMGLVIPSVDLVLVGADSILRDLTVVNKTGTYLAALVARSHDRGFFVAADTYKINAAMDSTKCFLEAKPGREVWPSQAKHCDNVYFDTTPRQLVTGFISEKGILDAEGMSTHVQHWQQLADALKI